VIDTDKGGVIAQIEKRLFPVPAPYFALVKGVFGKVEAQTGIEIAVNPARFLD
jgi:hypothetical protein